MESNLRSLYCFVTAAEEMNFTRAAKKLYITQQSLSKHIKKLEEQYEVSLFDRQPTLRLTMAGEHLLAYARRAIREENRLFNDLQSEVQFGRLRLHIGVPTLRGSNYLPDIYQAYSKIHPNVVISYYSYGFEAANTALMTGDIDMYFSTLASAGKYGRKTPIEKDELFFLVSEELLKQQYPDSWEEFLHAHSSGITVAETVDFPVVLPPTISTLRQILNSSYRSAPHAPKVIMELTDNRVNFDMCTRHICASFISKSLLFNRYLHTDVRLYAFHVTDLDKLSHLGIVYPENDHLSRYVEDYINCAKDVICSINATVDNYMRSRVQDGMLLPIDFHELYSRIHKL